jgi:hypothetical protein
LTVDLVEAERAKSELLLRELGLLLLLHPEQTGYPSRTREREDTSGYLQVLRAYGLAEKHRLVNTKQPRSPISAITAVLRYMTHLTAEGLHNL